MARPPSRPSRSAASPASKAANASQPRLRILLGAAIAIGPGKADLLDAIDRAGSISGAARELGMSYRRAWELVFARHEVLRTTVVWDGVPVPVAVVSRSVSLPWQMVDASDLDEAGRRQAIDGHLAADAARGADFTAPSLTRITVIRLAPDRHQMVWSYHVLFTARLERTDA